MFLVWSGKGADLNTVKILGVGDLLTVASYGPFVGTAERGTVADL